jgi:membrane protease subunit (stomatin/prohibitin family)
MAIIDRVKWDGSPDLLAWKFPSDELSTATQLIVNESQEAFLVSAGVYEGPYLAGRHTLSTDNIPVLRSLLKIPFGGNTPFPAEVWYVNKLAKLDVKWGTLDPIQLSDPKYNIMIPVRAFGQYGVRITDSKLFLRNIVGALASFDQDSLASYFRGFFVSTIKTEIARWIIRSKVSILDLSVHLDEISSELNNRLSEAVSNYGVMVERFSIQSINVPDDDTAFQSLKHALAKKAEMGILGFNYQQEQSFAVLKNAAANEGGAGALMGAGLGLGLGVGMGGPMGQIVGNLSLQNSNELSQSSANNVVGQVSNSVMSPSERISALKDLAELRSQGILTESEFESEKLKILGR